MNSNHHGRNTRTFWCALDGAPFEISIHADANVNHLKKDIKTEMVLAVATPSMVLWKLRVPEPVEPARTLGLRIGSRGDVTAFADELTSPTQQMSEVFPQSQLPVENYVHILVVLPLTQTSVKRPGTPDVCRKERKKPRIDMFPLESSLRSLHERLQSINPDFSQYSDPHYMTTFPFPFIGDRLPVERFDFRDLHFKYMGRTAFSELSQTVKKMRIGDGFSQLYIQGTMGYGKSHMLAVLAGVLSRNGHRVVYLPDCGELARNTMAYMRTALLCAFADPLLLDVRNEIRALESENDVIAFCQHNRSMYIIIDQIDALDHEDPNMDTVSNRWKEEVQRFLHRLTPGHFQITSASANHKTAMHMKKRQTNELKLELRGGMSEDEMKQWWTNNEQNVPILGDDDKARIEDLTGRIPLLLRPLLHFSGRPFDEIKTKFWNHHDLVAVTDNIFEFSEQKAKSETPLIYEQFYLPTLLSCLTASRVTYRSPEWFDHRYFYVDHESRGKYTCGLAREAATIFIHNVSPGLLCNKTWNHSLGL